MIWRNCKYKFAEKVSQIYKLDLDNVANDSYICSNWSKNTPVMF